MEAHFVEEKRDENGKVVDLEGWPIGTCWRYPQHKCIEDRIRNANEFRDKFGFPHELEFVVDSFPSNSFNSQYAAWPDSAYCVQRGSTGGEPKLTFKGFLEDEGMRQLPFNHAIESLLPT